MPLLELAIGSEFSKKACEQIAAAEKSIDIIIYHWRLYPSRPQAPISKFVEALHAAALRGVEIKVLCESDKIVAELRPYPFKVKRLYGKKLMHAKVLFVDKKLAIIGSHNYTNAGFSLNLEVSLIAELGAQAPILEQYFRDLWSV